MVFQVGSTDMNFRKLKRKLEGDENQQRRVVSQDRALLEETLQEFARQRSSILSLAQWIWSRRIDVVALKVILT